MGFFTQAVFRRAASAKSAVCKHIKDDNAVETSVPATDLGRCERPISSGTEAEKQLLLRIIGELEEKNRLLQENCDLLRDEVCNLRLPLRIFENLTKKHLTVDLLLV